MEVITNYFPDLDPGQLQQLASLKECYADWNAKINVISRKDIDHLYERHVLHSLAIARVISFKNDTAVLDAGTGGGFPGIPLAILFPRTRFLLVDSIGKKIRVVEDIADRLGLDNVRAAQERVENLKERFDFVISRAVTRLPVFYNWVNGKVARDSFNRLQNGILYLKGGDLSAGGELAAELAELPCPATCYSISDFFKESFFDMKYVVHIPVG
ncbi:MAG: 16S rRNA (guanine(527)-N(7))-methyltransferase RsmG [Solitalea sp.]